MYVNAVVRAIGNSVDFEPIVDAGEQPHFLYFWRFVVHECVIEEFQWVQIRIPIGKDVEMDVVEIITKSKDWPGHDIAKVAVGRNESTINRVVLISLVGSVNGCRAFGDCLWADRELLLGAVIGRQAPPCPVSLPRDQPPGLHRASALNVG